MLSTQPTHCYQDGITARSFQGDMELFDQDINLMEPEIRFRQDGRRIICVVTGDVDIRRAREILRNFRQSLRRLRLCWTCFQKPRAVINFPCGCLCNCLECSEHMSLCSLCSRGISARSQGVIF